MGTTSTASLDENEGISEYHLDISKYQFLVEFLNGTMSAVSSVWEEFANMDDETNSTSSDIAGVDGVDVELMRKVARTKKLERMHSTKTKTSHVMERVASTLSNVLGDGRQPGKR